MIEPKYFNVSQQIAGDISANKWRDRLPGVTVLAKHYGVAPSTIAKAVRELAKRGHVTIQGTRGAFISSPDRTRPQYGVVGVVGLIQRTQASDELAEMDQVATRHRLSLITIGSALDLAGAKPEFFVQLPVDGLVFTNSILNRPIAAALRQAGVPFASTNRIFDVEGVDWVDFDNETMLDQALHHLFALGRRRIACIGFKFAIPEHEARLKRRYDQFMAAHGDAHAAYWALTTFQSDYWRQHPEAHYYAAYGRETIDQLMRLDHPPDAIFVHHEEIAAAVCADLQARGVKLPADLPVVAVRTRPPAGRPLPLHAIGLAPTVERARRVMATLAERIRHPHREPSQTLLPVPLVRLENHTPAPRHL